MIPLEKSEPYVLSNGVGQYNLLICGKYISLYINELCSIYSINCTEEEHNKTCKILSQAMLDLIIEFQQSANMDLSKQITNIIHDFESNSKKGIGNLIPLLDRARRNEQTNTRIITELSDIFMPEDYNFPTKPDN